MAVPQITTLPTPPDKRDDPLNFEENADNFLGALPDFGDEANVLATTVNGYAVSAAASQVSCTASELAAVGAANNKGEWSALTGALSVPASVNHSGIVWVLNEDIPDVTASEPTALNTDWINVTFIDENGDADIPGSIEIGVDADISGNLDVTGTLNIDGNNIQQQEIQNITASVAANALTIGLLGNNINFRKADLTNGSFDNLSFTSLSLVIPSGATLGTVSAVESELIPIAINYLGAVELAVVNISGGNNLTETGIITTVAIDASSDSANVVYSDTARVGVPYRVVGSAKSTQATAGTWATTPSAVQGLGGQALSSMSSLGYGQTPQDVTGSRTSGVTYYNSGRPFTIIVRGPSGGQIIPVLNGVTLPQVLTGSANVYPYLVMPILAGASYSITSVGFTGWFEIK